MFASQSFCEETINVRSAANQNDLVLITKELPALWPNILEIVNLEKSEYLPQDMSRIILKMIQIRRNTFRNSAERLDEDYIHWESPEEEHPTAFYPQWPIFWHPKKYNVRYKTDSNFCEKAFDSKKVFAVGVFFVRG